MFNYDYLFGDHFKNVSAEARLYYIELSFSAINGFVANARSIANCGNYPSSVFKELVDNGDLLTLPDRSEVFITSYFIHNKGISNLSWTSTQYYPYWKGKLFIKKNGVATFNPQPTEPKMDLDTKVEARHQNDNDPLKNIVDDEPETQDCSDFFFTN